MCTSERTRAVNTAESEPKLGIFGLFADLRVTERYERRHGLCSGRWWFNFAGPSDSGRISKCLNMKKSDRMDSYLICHLVQEIV
jgi:hypothetical protein